jgi:hypothetical protein
VASLVFHFKASNLIQFEMFIIEMFVTQQLKTPALKSGGPKYDSRVRLHAIAFTTFTPPAPLSGHPLV